MYSTRNRGKEIFNTRLAWARAPTISLESPYLELLILIDFLSEYYEVLESLQPLEDDLK